MILNPELQFSGNNEVATVKLDIFGEVVVTLGTVPQGQGHETTSSQVVAEILGCTPDDVNVRAGHDTYWNSTAGFSGTYASQFAVTGLGAVKGATEKLAGEMKQLAAAVFGCSPDDIELVESQARIKGNPEAALPFMALGAILNANNAGLPPDLDITLNVRHVYRPHFEKPDLERKFGNLTLTYATQIHACAVEIDPETGVYEIVDYAAVDDCGNRIHPQIVEGQVHGATAQALGAATHEIFTYDEEGNLLTPNFYDYHVPHAMDMPPMKNGFIESESPFTPLGAKGMGEGGGAGYPRGLRSAAERTRQPRRRARSSGGAATPTRACGTCCRSPRRRASSSAWRADEGQRGETVRGAAGDGVAGLERPGADGEDDARRGVVRHPGRQTLACPREDPARARRAAHVDRLREDGGARTGVRQAARQGQRRRRGVEHGHLVQSDRGRGPTNMKWEAEVHLLGPVASMGQRVLQPIINQQVSQVLGTLDAQVQEAKPQ